MLLESKDVTELAMPFGATGCCQGKYQSLTACGLGKARQRRGDSVLNDASVEVAREKEKAPQASAYRGKKGHPKVVKEARHLNHLEFTKEAEVNFAWDFPNNRKLDARCGTPLVFCPIILHSSAPSSTKHTRCPTTRARMDAAPDSIHNPLTPSRCARPVRLAGPQIPVALYISSNRGASMLNPYQAGFQQPAHGLPRHVIERLVW